eukprot:365984-Chlamydomonas_euryale.AAC.3
MVLWHDQVANMHGPPHGRHWRVGSAYRLRGSCLIDVRAAMTLQVSQIQSQSYRQRTHEGYACVECSKAGRIKQRARRCHKGHVTGATPETAPTA